MMRALTLSLLLLACEVPDVEYPCELGGRDCTKDSHCIVAPDRRSQSCQPKCHGGCECCVYAPEPNDWYCAPLHYCDE